MTKLDMADWRSWALLFAVTSSLEALSDRVSESGEISPEDVKLLAENVGYLKDFKPDKD